MSNYEELINKVRSGQYDLQVDAFKKLVYLAVNDQATFKRFAIRILAQLTVVMPDLVEEDGKLLCLQLLSEIAGSYKQFVPKSGFNFSSIVPCLSDEKVEIRKSSHYMILTFVKKYEELDPILHSYEQIGRSTTCPWKLAQKIIHSFQSLIVVEPRCVKYSKDYTAVDQFLGFVFEKDVCDNVLVKKASSQALTSFVKNQYVPQIIPSLSKSITNKLLQYSKSINYFPFSEKVSQRKPSFKPDPEEQYIEEIAISFTPSNITSNQSIPNFNYSPQSPVRKGSSIERRREKLVIPNISPLNEVKLEDPLEGMIERIDSCQPWNVKCQAIGEIYNYLMANKVLEFPDTLIERVLQLTSDLNFKTSITSLNTIGYFINESFKGLRLYQEKLEDILADKVCEMKAAIRKIASKVIKELIITHNQHRIVRVLMHRIKTCSFSGKEQILELMQQVYTTSAQDDYGFVVGELAGLLFQDNTSIKSKAMSTIITIAQNSNLEECKTVLSKKLNKVYYDMFTQKLKQKHHGWPSKAQSLQVDTTPVTKLLDNEYAMTYTDMRPNAISRLAKDQGKDGSNTVSNFGSFPSSSPDHKLGIIGRKQKNQEFQKQEQTEKDKSYQYKPTLSRKANPRSEIIQVSAISLEDKLIVESEQYKGRRPEQETRKVPDEMSKQASCWQQPIPSQDQKQPKINSKPFNSKKSYNVADKNEEKQESTTGSNFSKSTGLKKIPSKQPRIPDYKTTTYLSKQEIQPLHKPEGALKKIVIDIKKEDEWSLQFECLNGIRKIIKHHKAEFMGLVQNLSQIMPEVIRLVDSLRSGLAKNAMITLCQLCECLKKQMDPFLEIVFIKLFKKGCDANTFISEQAKKCITILCFYCSSQKITPIIISSFQSKQAQVRVLTMLMIEKISTRSNIHPVNFLKENIKLVNILGQYLVDSNNEVRTNTKAYLVGVARSYSRAEVEQAFRKNVSEEASIRLKGILDKELTEGIFVRTSSRKNIDLD